MKMRNPLNLLRSDKKKTGGAFEVVDFHAFRCLFGLYPEVSDKRLGRDPCYFLLRCLLRLYPAERLLTVDFEKSPGLLGKSGSRKNNNVSAFWLNSGRWPSTLVRTLGSFLTSYNVPSGVLDVLSIIMLVLKWSNETSPKKGARQGRLSGYEVDLPAITDELGQTAAQRERKQS